MSRHIGSFFMTVWQSLQDGGCAYGSVSILFGFVIFRRSTGDG